MKNTQQTLQIDPQFRGPPDSGNGGYTSGLLASAIDGACEITLHAPPPLACDLQLASDGTQATLKMGDTLIGSAHAKALQEFALQAAPSYEQALARQPDYAGFRVHNFPGCYVCGPDRVCGDGLRVFAAPNGTSVVAAWQPAADLADATGLVAERYLHSALDCPSYYALRDSQLMALLGRMHSEVIALPRAEERCVVIAWPLARDGRKSTSAVAVYGEKARLLARARNTWIELKGPVPKPPA